MKKKYQAKITYTVDAQHPDIKYIKEWRNKVFSFEDTYIIDKDYFSNEDDILSYIKKDLRLIAGGGYNFEHIHNVNFDIVEEIIPAF